MTLVLALLVLWVLLALVAGVVLGRAARLGDEHPRRER